MHAFRALLRRNYNVFVTTEANNALKLIEENNVALVITDYKMPKMTGVEFLELVRDHHPETVRILISGHADLTAIVESVNKGEVFRFINKPWVDELLINEIEKAFEIYDARQILKTKNNELQSAYKELSHFTFSAAHNLTGPVATIHSLIDLMRDDPIKIEEFLGYLEQTTHTLSNHLKNIISFNQNKSELVKIERINVSAYIKEITSSFEFYPGFEEMKIDFDCNSSLYIESDQTRLNSILSNIIVNAIKYRDLDKSVNMLSFRCRDTAEYTEIRVWDNGIGIEEQNLEKVTDIFFREATGRLGSGIGLFIVMQAVEMLNGTIEIDSEKGAFTEVTLRLGK